ncbi:hypothetical protein XHV734_4833 [Xanthomonas hortorum pv. vitians]|nr:hypothetical protein XHV734_4833 [Xanthomonas hortorum pv. vitians]
MRRADVRSMAAAVLSLLAQAYARHRLRMADTGRATSADDFAHSDAHEPVQRRLSWWLQVLRYRQASTFRAGQVQVRRLPACAPTCRASPPSAAPTRLHATQLR